MDTVCLRSFLVWFVKKTHITRDKLLATLQLQIVGRMSARVSQAFCKTYLLLEYLTALVEAQGNRQSTAKRMFTFLLLSKRVVC